jgi:uncharacterized protein
MKKHVVRVFSHWGLLLHIYISMVGFTLVLLFAVTGVTLNHQDFGWGDPVTTNATITVPADLADHPSEAVVGNYLKGSLGIRSPLTDYREDPDQMQVTFAAPGHRTVVTVNRAARTADVETETRGLLGKLDDLHKGFDSGRAWYWIIDLTSAILVLSALTGMATLVSLRHRRRSGFLVAGLGVATIVVIYLIWVPR